MSTSTGPDAGSPGATGSTGAPGASERPRRVVVTSPRMRALPHQPRRVVHEIDEQTSVGELYVRSLVRTQRRLALLVLGVVGVLLLGLPPLFRWVPDLARTTLLGVPLPWWLLGVVTFPMLVAAGWFYVRQAERNEREFTELVEAADSTTAAHGAEPVEETDRDPGRS